MRYQPLSETENSSLHKRERAYVQKKDGWSKQKATIAET